MVLFANVTIKSDPLAGASVSAPLLVEIVEAVCPIRLWFAISHCGTVPRASIPINPVDPEKSIVEIPVDSTALKKMPGLFVPPVDLT